MEKQKSASILDQIVHCECDSIEFIIFSLLFFFQYIISVSQKWRQTRWRTWHQPCIGDTGSHLRNHNGSMQLNFKIMHPDGLEVFIECGEYLDAEMETKWLAQSWRRFSWKPRWSSAIGFSVKSFSRFLEMGGKSRHSFGWSQQCCCRSVEMTKCRYDRRLITQKVVKLAQRGYIRAEWKEDKKWFPIIIQWK